MKRAFDITTSTIVFILFFPIFIVVSVLIKLDSPGPILFKQKRPGLNNKLFNIYKFRSMKVDTPNVSTDKLEGGKIYVTNVGKVIRKTSIDELPQLINIIKGDMSVVGPRPALFNQYELIEKRTERGIHKIRPGLTGYAQVMGRDDLNDDEKVKYDEYYVKHQSFLFDLKIIFMTILKIFKSEGVKH
ncbi:lipid carrier--UDP-N-acetylgalactosaminyltransferase [Macrococcus epidermidis]|uniref:Lipid carrier--UDP-N-acetylgalactosaminyltransferase n=1 Tax=Macrococcus epidermidis TaxID=1902580 RepID=A0A327ZPL0_9STAP|nr:sugar transferase [Macrococcus epidermidis]RAK44106.1 lipid carrier--UDP-N-acetylgalactosaminyltransferase [Macrococcus epidermidis]